MIKGVNGGQLCGLRVAKDVQGWSRVVKGRQEWSRGVKGGQGRSRVVIDCKSYLRKCFKYGSIIHKEDSYSSNMFHVCVRQSHRHPCVLSVFEANFRAQVALHAAMLTLYCFKSGYQADSSASLKSQLKGENIKYFFWLHSMKPVIRSFNSTYFLKIISLH